MGRADALRNAQLALRRKHPDPYFWGAFLCQGDPAPLRASEPSTSQGARWAGIDSPARTADANSPKVGMS